MRAYLLLCFIYVILLTHALGQSGPRMREADKIRIREAISISDKYGEAIWTGINRIPFTVMLVTDSVEFLINHPLPSSDFALLEWDSLLKTKIYYRPREFDQHILATFPAVNSKDCVVVGTPENANKNSAEWIIILLHEHFHQYEYAYPDYYKAVNGLGLTNSSQSSWMLDYPFPYDSSAINQQFKKYMKSLSKALTSIGTAQFASAFEEYKLERKRAQELLKASDYRYFSFQIWQEGIARYTEYKFLESLIDYSPFQETLQLADFSSFSTMKNDFYKSQIHNLETFSLMQNRRLCFYSIGFAEGLLLDYLNPDWRARFLTDKFYIERYSDSFK